MKTPITTYHDINFTCSSSSFHTDGLSVRHNFHKFDPINTFSDIEVLAGKGEFPVPFTMEFMVDALWEYCHEDGTITLVSYNIGSMTDLAFTVLNMEYKQTEPTEDIFSRNPNVKELVDMGIEQLLHDYRARAIITPSLAETLEILPPNS